MAVLSDVEKDLMDLIGESAISGHTEVADPLEGPSSTGSNPYPEEIVPHTELQSQFLGVVEPATPRDAPDPGPSTTQIDEPPNQRKRKRDEDIDDRMAAAMERQAGALAEIGQQIGLLTDSLPSERIAAAIEHQAEALTEVGQQIGRLVDFLLMLFNWWNQQANEL